MLPPFDLDAELERLQAHRARGDKRATALLCGVVLERQLKELAVQVLASETAARRDALRAALGDTSVDQATLGALLRGLERDKFVGRHKAELWRVRKIRNWAAHDSGDEPNAMVVDGCVDLVHALVEARTGRSPQRSSAPMPAATTRRPGLMWLVVGGVVLAAGSSVWILGRTPQAGQDALENPTEASQRKSSAPDDGAQEPSRPDPKGGPSQTDSTPAGVSAGALPATLPLTVLLYGSGAGLPDADDRSERRRFLGETLLPALLRSGVRAVVLDFDFVGGASDASTDALRSGLTAMNHAGIPVVAVRPLGRVSEIPICTDGNEGCLFDLGDAVLPDEKDSWPLCIGGMPTLGHQIARLLESSGDHADFHSDFWCLDEPLAIQLPDPDPCQAPWKRLWVSELLTGEPLAGPDPVTRRSSASCGTTATDLRDTVVVVGDPRISAEGQDVVELGRTTRRAFAGAEAHAVVAWNTAPLLR